jgi:hypothetical protein
MLGWGKQTSGRKASDFFITLEAQVRALPKKNMFCQTVIDEGKRLHEDFKLL